MENVTFKNCLFIQGGSVENEERFLKPNNGDVFDGCTFIVRKDRAAINFFYYEKVEFKKLHNKIFKILNKLFRAQLQSR